MPFLIAAAVLLLLLLGVEYFIFRFAVSRKPIVLPGSDEFGGGENPWAPFQQRIDEGREMLLSRPHEKVTIRSFDGLTLAGTFFPCDGEAKRILLEAHGFRSSWQNDFSLSAGNLMEEGCSLLLIDERTHGESEGKYITYGVRESRDVKDWCLWLAERFGPEMPVYLAGISMGCTTVLMAAGRDLPDNVKGIIADCGFTSPAELFKHEMKHLFRLPWQPFLWLFRPICRLFAGFDPDESTLDALKGCSLPILFVHGGKDDFVPTRMTRENYDSYEGPGDLLIVEEADHGCSYAVAEEEYRRRVKALFERGEGV